jgi:hypothetical protein
VAWTQTQLDALEAAIARGVRTVTYGDKSVTYSSLIEMMALRSTIVAELAAAGGADTSRTVRVRYSRD